ncbi:MAG: amino acid ABC transporter substrate-binding protein [Ruminococcaceae bacterium]|nr:amino acid ABC transporter substrate-binding protein [Oscillospiraceae bacterium]
MKKTVSLILALMLVLSVCLSGCTAEKAADTAADTGADTGTVQKYGNIGRLSKLNITEDELNEVLKDIMVDSICNKYVFYDTMNDMIMALNKGDIVVLETDQNTVRYIASRNDLITDRAPYMNPNMLTFCMLLREEDTELRDQISACIAEMNEDGTIETMKQTYIEDVIAGKDPGAVEPQVFPGAKSIKVAVTGDRPPMDYVSADGKPQGFNTALIAEVAKRLELNIEMVNVNSAARGIALATGTCDIVFWMEVGDFENWEGADLEDQPENTVVTEPYMSVPLWWAVLKDSPVVNLYRDN